MDVAVIAHREGDRARLIPTGPFDLPHARTAASAIASAETALTGCRSVELELADVVDIDGTGAVQLARLLDRVEATGPRTEVVEAQNPKAARLIALYRQRRTLKAPVAPRRRTILGRLGSIADSLPRALTRGLDFIGHDAVAVPQAVAAPSSVDWRSVPHLIQVIGADGLAVTGAANLLVGLIIGFLGVSQLGRFGVTVYVPELVVVAHFRELGPLVTAIVVAGRSGAMAGRASLHRARPRRPGAHVDRRCAGASWRTGRHHLPHRHVDAGVCDGHGRRDHRNELPRGIDQDSLPGAGDRADRLRPGAGDARRRSRSRRANDDRRRPLDLWRHRDQLGVHLFLRADGPVTMPDPRPHIVVDDLRIGWGSRVLMEHVSFDVQRGAVFTILGGSGCGKSSLLRYLIGLEQPLSGTIDIDGIGTPHQYEGVPRFGVLFQSGALFSSMTLAENLALPLTTWTPVRGHLVEDLVQAKLDLVGLGAFAGHLPGEISGGMKKRAGIARAMMLEPDLLFFDEPSAGLDPISAYELDQLILTLSRDLGITIVIVTHELPSIFLVADSCIVLDKVAKGIVARGNPREVRDQSNIPFVHAFFTRSSPPTIADQGV